MVEMLQVQIRHPGVALTEKERKLVDSLVQRICVHHVRRRLTRPFRIRRSLVDSIHLLVNQDVIVEDGLTDDEARLIMDDLASDIRQTLAYCDVSTEEVVLTAKA
ncbi:hypothetical protein NZD89_01195 [Alicyclobacillus fastidiosus]|uniref:Uncharacterized protein n=1 Tax=Alicyclobacillus fastidiosus TaxID=392011 RepID=A0ABY6ZH41_9BACL|nr:hypothetical protein [Alicyclobacillus fastidiosus]WAH42162.1 hypothetical protein NZD89_01195 [Alicyclobacillus fastidiosus]GMA63954.1 hypothetical protein GCM10025859_43940 [Alicyclobacillus fastidiosus]